MNWKLHKNHLREHMNLDEIWWGEGPLKGDLAANLTNKLHLQVAGVAQWSLLLEPTKELRPKRVVLTFDADAQDKEDTVGLNVTNAVKEAKKELQPLGIDVAIVLWPSNVAKGLDDFPRWLQDKNHRHSIFFLDSETRDPIHKADEVFFMGRSLETKYKDECIRPE